MAVRTRNHRRDHCGTCESITKAHYYLSSEPLGIKDKLKLFASLKVPCEQVDDVFVFIFNDSSLLAFKEDVGFYKVDTFLRKSNRRFA